MNILVTQPEGQVKDTFFTTAEIDKLHSIGNVTWNPSSKQFSRDDLREKLRGIDVCISGWGCERFDEFVLQNADKLKIIAHTGGSVSTIVSDELYERGIKVISGNWIYAESVAEGVLAYILASLRELPYYNSLVQNGGWRTEFFHNESLLDQTVGLVGFGSVAKYLVEMLKPFRTEIKVYDPYVTDILLKEYGVVRAELEEIFRDSKIISLHVPQIPETFHMVDKELLESMQEGALIINTARGSVIDENALAEVLQAGKIKAVLDVYEEEPLPSDSKLRGLSNAILIPHMGGPTIDRRRFVTAELIKDIESFMEGGSMRFEISKGYAAAMSTATATPKAK